MLCCSDIFNRAVLAFDFRYNMFLWLPEINCFYLALGLSLDLLTTPIKYPNVFVPGIC